MAQCQAHCARQRIQKCFWPLFGRKVVLVKYEVLWPISLLMLPKCCQRLAAGGHPVSNPCITFNLKVISTVHCIIVLSVQEPWHIVCTIVLLICFSSFQKPCYHALSLGPSLAKLRWSIPAQGPHTKHKRYWHLSLVKTSFHPSISVTKLDSLSGVQLHWPLYPSVSCCWPDTRCIPASKNLLCWLGLQSISWGLILGKGGWSHSSPLHFCLPSLYCYLQVITTACIWFVICSKVCTQWIVIFLRPLFLDTSLGLAAGNICRGGGEACWAAPSNTPIIGDTPIIGAPLTRLQWISRFIILLDIIFLTLMVEVSG